MATNKIYAQQIERMLEESGEKNVNQLGNKLGGKELYTYKDEKRGITKGLLQTFLAQYPEADLNYIFKGERSKLPSNPETLIRFFMSQYLNNNGLSDLTSDITDDEKLLRFIHRLLFEYLRE